MRSLELKLGALVFFCVFNSAPGDEPTNATKQVTHPSSTPRTNILASLHVRSGFQVELAAVEPMVVAPVAMAFDENGRLFVAEMRDYPNQREAKPHLGRIRVLEAPDEQGIFQTSTVYADDLPLPSALACYAGGIFVAVTPQILYLKNSQSEGTADISRIVFTGFGGSNAPSSSALLNNFNWGLDNRIHGATAGVGGTITAHEWSGGPVTVAGSDFAFDPRSLALELETGPAQSGLTFDDYGHKFISEPDHPLRLVAYERRYTLRNPFFPRAAELIDVANPATPINRNKGSGTVSPELVAVRGDTAGASSTNLLSSSWLTAARGAVVYRGGAFPTGYTQNVFVPDSVAHVVHRFVLREQGLGVVADTVGEDRQSEFLASDDRSFRPVQAINGPDGALYVADMGADNEHGRIYRIVPDHFQRPKPPQLGTNKTEELVALLARGNGWQQDTAARLLFERHEAAATPLLRSMLSNSKVRLARLHALGALDGNGGLTVADVGQALRDPDPGVRERAVLLSERFVQNGMVPDLLWGQLRSLTADPAPRVRYQLAFTLGEIRRPDRTAVLAEILARDLGNAWIETAVLSSLNFGAGDFFGVLIGRFRSDVSGFAFLTKLATLIGIQGRLGDVAQVQTVLTRPDLDRVQVFTLLQALGDGLHRTRSSLGLTDPQAHFAPYYLQALNVAIDLSVPETARASAVRLLGTSPYKFTDIGDWLVLLCNPQPYPTLQSAAIEALGHFDEPGAVKYLFASWPTMTLPLRQQTLATLLTRTSHVAAVLDGIETGLIPAATLSSTQLDFLRNYREAAISQRAIKLFGPTPRRRPDLVAQFSPAVLQPGLQAHGRQIFFARCAGCHVFYGQGQSVGPDLTGIRVRGRQKILSAIVEPNAEVPTGYATSVILSKEGENLVGIRSDDNLNTLTLSQPRGVRIVWPQLNVQAMEAQTWSLMPSGLEQGMNLQDMADLLEYLMTGNR